MTKAAECFVIDRMGLVIELRLLEKIVINGELEITLVLTKSKRARLVIDGDKSKYRVDRGPTVRSHELVEEKKAAEQLSAFALGAISQTPAKKKESPQN